MIEQPSHLHPDVLAAELYDAAKALFHYVPHFDRHWQQEGARPVIDPHTDLNEEWQQDILLLSPVGNFERFIGTGRTNDLPGVFSTMHALLVKHRMFAVYFGVRGNRYLPSFAMDDHHKALAEAVKDGLKVAPNRSGAAT